MTKPPHRRRAVVACLLAAGVLSSCSNAPSKVSSASARPTGSTSASTTPSANATGPSGAHLSALAQEPSKATILAPPAQTLTWSDEFSGAAGSAPNPAYWTPQLGGSGWGNQELECYTASRSNSALDGQGDLVITALSQPATPCSDGKVNNYTSARLSTEGLKTFEYGSIQVRAQLPTGAGIWPAIWALGANHATIGWPSSGEIDISEVVGFDPATVNGSLHGPISKNVPYKFTNKTTLPAPVSNGFHLYAVTWTSTMISFSVDDHVYYTVPKSTVTGSGPWVFDQPFYLLLNVAVGGQWPGSPNSTTPWPQRMLVDYVRVYQDK